MKRREPARILERWRPRLLLGEWNFNLVYPKNDDDCEHGDVLADINCDTVYLNATIRVYPAWFRKDKTTREHAIVHELCHCFAEEAWKAIRCQANGVNMPAHVTTDIMERLTQRIANAVFWQERGRN